MGAQESKTFTKTSTRATSRSSSIIRSPKSKKVMSFTLEKDIVDNRYGGKIKVVRRAKNTRDYVQIQKKVNSQLALEREIRLLNRRILSPHPNLLRVDCFTHHDEQKCCNIEWVINIYVEYLEKDLEQEISEKRQKLASYQEHELIYLIENLSMGINNFEKSQNPHSDVRPSNILIDSFGVYKFIDHEIVQCKNTHEVVQKKLLAPEFLKSTSRELAADQSKADVFSFGMTVLQAATLEPSNELYDYAKGEIDVEELERRLDIVKIKYSQNIYDLLASALEFDPDSRIKIEAICDRLSELGDSLVGKGTAQSYVLDRVHANQGVSTNDLSIDKGIQGLATGLESTRGPTPIQPCTKIMLLSRSHV